MIARILSAFLFTLFLSTSARAQSGEVKLDFSGIESLAIQEGGRVKPVETFAHESVLRITGRGRTKIEAFGRKWEPADFLLSMMFDQKAWREEPLILVAYRPLVKELGLDDTKKRFPFSTLATNQKLIDLAGQGQKLQADGKNDSLSREQKEALAVADRLTRWTQIESGDAFTIVPSPDGGAWRAAGELPKISEPGAKALGEVAEAYVSRNLFAFSTASTRLQETMRQVAPASYPTAKQLQIERTYNRLDPFDWAAIAYGVAWLCLAFSTRGSKWGTALGFVIMVAGIAVHATGITLRCIVAGRPPVTNMFESIVWVSFGVAFFGFLFFLRYRSRLYLLSALPASALSLLLLAQLPASMPENIDPLVPVLQSNFWLTIHVLTITLSYAAFLLAMAFGHVVLWRYATNPTAAESDRTLHFWLYRVLQLGVLLLAAGTILGGVWANYSWGRFWGWDPKETWALIALLCYIFVLHGRLAGWWNHFGLAFASVICFAAVVMTWYGVNFVLGKGLHSYGFGTGGEGYVYAFVAIDLLFATIAGIRHRSTLRQKSGAISNKAMPQEV